MHCHCIIIDTTQRKYALNVYHWRPPPFGTQQCCPVVLQRLSDPVARIPRAKARPKMTSCAYTMAVCLTQGGSGKCRKPGQLLPIRTNVANPDKWCKSGQLLSQIRASCRSKQICTFDRTLILTSRVFFIHISFGLLERVRAPSPRRPRRSRRRAAPAAPCSPGWAARPRRRVYSGAAGSGGAEFLPNFVVDLEDGGNTQARCPRYTESSADRCYYFADREAEAHEQDADGDVRQDTPILRFHMHRDSI